MSVVVPTFNRRASLQRLLDALLQQTYPASEFEVVVVDDGSTDGTVEFLRALRTPYTLRVLEQPHEGPAAARNRGVQHSRGGLIVFLDDDVTPRTDLIAQHVAAHENGSNLVVVGPMSSPPDWQRPAWIRWEETKLQIQYRALMAGEYECSGRQFYTGNASLKRTDFLRAGGFDARFTRAEDIELGFRLWQDGLSFRFEPLAEVLHYPNRSFESWCRTPYQYGRSDAVMQRDKGHGVLTTAIEEFRERHVLSRLLVRLCLGRRILTTAAIFALSSVVHVADKFGVHGPSVLALSGIFNLLYWQGVSDELGVPFPVWRSNASRLLTA